ncbi:hypothetical protein VNO78_21436 [Psophocarpus tetragonolobus]|uniref:Probable sodium/metabolite cotransporter BASS4, chloroplastic n=1 Tax=Psophocarpus tetragonolobus TaxID=3891 RepID=A0AAN9SCC2_PSOTE
MFTSATVVLRVQPPHSAEPMAHSLTLTPFPATPSSLRRRLLYAVKPLTLRSVTRRLKPSLVRACDRSQQMGGNGSIEMKELSWVEPILKFSRNNILPIALISAVTLGLTYPSLGCAADKYGVSKMGPFGIFVISGLMLRSEEIGTAVKAWPVGLYGLVSILFLTPYFSRVLLQIQLQPQEFITGLAIFTCMPTTLSSGVALTQLAGGNSALALAMTVITNMLGIFIIPLSIAKFVAGGVGVALPTKQLFKSLVLSILIPLILGKVLRESIKGVADFVDKNRKLVSVISALFLSLVPWTQVSRSRPLLLMVKPSVFLVAIGLGALLHMSLLAFNILAVWSLSVISGGRKSIFSQKENASALILVASQKTLPVMVAVIEPLQGAFGESGLLVLPCVAAHLIQIIFDTFIINFLRHRDDSNNSSQPRILRRCRPVATHPPSRAASDAIDQSPRILPVVRQPSERAFPSLAASDAAAQPLTPSTGRRASSQSRSLRCHRPAAAHPPSPAASDAVEQPPRNVRRRQPATGATSDAINQPPRNALNICILQAESFVLNIFLREVGATVLVDYCSLLLQHREMKRKIALIFLVAIFAFAYQAIHPPSPRTCGSPSGPPITAPRIKLRDGRHLAYKEHGVPRELAKKKIVYIHGFGSSRHDAGIARTLFKGVVEELGVYIVSFDRPGYGESDPHPNRTMKSLALDVEELADKLGLGAKFYVMGFSMGGQAIWGILKFIPHRLAGATLLTPVVNYWWHNLPSNISTKAYYEQLTQDQWALRVAHYLPWLTYWWFTQNWFPSSSVVQHNPLLFTTQDLSIMSKFSVNTHHQSQVKQQGEAESICRDAIVGFGRWDFDPLDIDNPFPDNTGHVHLWQGDDDKLVPVTLQRYIAQKIPWIQYHEVPGSGHLFPYLEDVSQNIIKTQLVD